VHEASASAAGRGTRHRDIAEQGACRVYSSSAAAAAAARTSTSLIVVHGLGRNSNASSSIASTQEGVTW